MFKKLLAFFNEQKSDSLSLGEWEITFNSIPDFIFIMDKSHTIVKANKAFADMFHVRPEELIGRKCFEIVHQSHHPFPKCPFEETLLDSKAHTEEIIDPHLGGAVLLITTAPLLSKTGEVQGAVHIAKDITAFKQAENALRESEERYRTLVDNLNIGIYRNTAGPEGHFLQVNPFIVKLFGYASRDEFMKLKVADLYVRREERQEFMTEIMQNGSAQEKELFLRKKDGTTFWAAVTARLSRDEKGDILWIDGTLQDITERKRLREDMQKHIDALERFQRVTVERELRMKELKKEIGELKNHPQ
jgi:PAS domain S-box-containing protein